MCSHCAKADEPRATGRRPRGEEEGRQRRHTAHGHGHGAMGMLHTAGRRGCQRTGGPAVRAVSCVPCTLQHSTRTSGRAGRVAWPRLGLAAGPRWRGRARAVRRERGRGPRLSRAPCPSGRAAAGRCGLSSVVSGACAVRCPAGGRGRGAWRVPGVCAPSRVRRGRPES